MDYRFSMEDAMDVAAKKIGIEGWQAHSWESVTGGSLVTGEVPDGVYTKGKRKGEPRFGSGIHERRVVVSDSELQQEAKRYEEETGNCWDCKGTSQVWAGWSADEGVRYRPCDRCGATGKASA